MYRRQWSRFYQEAIAETAQGPTMHRAKIRLPISVESYGGSTIQVAWRAILSLARLDISMQYSE